MNFKKTQSKLNMQLSEIWAYQTYASPEEKIQNNARKKIQFIQKIESQALFYEEKYTALRRIHLWKIMEKRNLEKLAKKSRNLELRISLRYRLIKIERKVKLLIQMIKKCFSDYCSVREQVIEFRGRYTDMYNFHCEYYAKVNSTLFYT